MVLTRIRLGIAGAAGGAAGRRLRPRPTRSMPVTSGPLTPGVAAAAGLVAWGWSPGGSGEAGAAGLGSGPRVRLGLLPTAASAPAGVGRGHGAGPGHGAGLAGRPARRQRPRDGGRWPAPAPLPPSPPAPAVSCRPGPGAGGPGAHGADVHRWGWLPTGRRLGLAAVGPAGPGAAGGRGRPVPDSGVVPAQRPFLVRQGHPPSLQPQRVAGRGPRPGRRPTSPHIKHRRPAAGGVDRSGPGRGPSERGRLPFELGRRPYFTDDGHQGHLHVGFPGPTRTGER